MKCNNTPSIRFAGFTDAWEQRKLGDFCKIDIGEFVIRTKQRDDAPYPVYNGGSSYTGFYDEYNQDGKKVIVSARGANAGFVNKCATPYWAGNSCYSIGVLDDTAWIFLYHAIKHVQLSFIKGQQSANIPSVSKVQVQKTEVACPNSQEQQKIATLLEDIDRLITLHQRKYDQLVNIKKSMLDKMFPKNGETVPEVRFAGFTDAWEQREFADVFTYLQNNTLSRAELNEVGNGAKNIHYGDILVKFGECINVADEPLPIVTDEKIINKYRASLLQNGDIVMADTAEDETVGKCVEIIDRKSEMLISGLHTIPCRPSQTFSEGYLGYYMNSSAYHDQLVPLMQGIKVTSISKSALQTTIVQYPNEQDEQARIGQFSRNLDRLITLHQHKLERLQNLKKACLEKMFV